jgi:hypothetical protein
MELADLIALNVLADLIALNVLAESTNLIELAKKLKINIKKLFLRETMKKIEEYLKSNKVHGLRLYALQKSHCWERSIESSSSENDSNSDDSSIITIK